MIRILDVKDLTNLLLSSFGSGGSKADDSALLTKLLLDHLMQNKVSRPEIVRPFTGAMDFIDTNHGDFPTEFRQVFHEQPLGSDE